MSHIPNDVRAKKTVDLIFNEIHKALSKSK